MEQRHPPRLARPYVLDGADDDTAQFAEPAARMSTDRVAAAHGPAAQAPAAQAPAAAAHASPDPEQPAASAGDARAAPAGDDTQPIRASAETPGPWARPTSPAGRRRGWRRSQTRDAGRAAVAHRPHAVTPHHLWAAPHHLAPGRNRLTRPVLDLFGAHGMTATFVVIVVGVAATVLAVAAIKGRTADPTADRWVGASSPGGPAGGPDAEPSGEPTGPPLPTGTPGIPPAPGSVLPGELPAPIGNAAGVPAGTATSARPGAAQPTPGQPGAGRPGPARPGAGPPATPTGGAAPAPTTPPTAPPAPQEPPGTAFSTIQGESFDGQNGVRTEAAESGGGRHVGFISTGDWVRYEGVTFTGDTARRLVLRASNGARENRTGRVELRLDRRSNAPIGSMTIPNNGKDKWFAFSTYGMAIAPTTGVHTVYLTFTSSQNEEFANVDWLTFAP